SLAELGFVGGIPYIVAVVVCIMLGRLVDRYAERGHDPIRVQLRVFALSAALMPLGALITMASSAFVAVAIITVVVAVCQAWFVGYNLLLAGLFPVKINASAVGILGAVGASTSLVLNLLAGSLLAQFDYIAVFAGLAILQPGTAVILFLVLGRARTRRAAVTGACSARGRCPERALGSDALGHGLLVGRALNMVEKAARGPVRDLLEGQEQRGKRRLHEPRERKISPSHHHHIVGNADVALAQRTVQAEG